MIIKEFVFYESQWQLYNLKDRTGMGKIGDLSDLETMLAVHMALWAPNMNPGLFGKFLSKGDSQYPAVLFIFLSYP